MVGTLEEGKYADLVGRISEKNDLAADDEKALKAAVESIPTINRSFVGLTVKIGARYEAKMGDSTYSYASVLEFDDVDGLQSYLNHPMHERIGQLFWQHCERTLISDVD